MTNSLILLSAVNLIAISVRAHSIICRDVLPDGAMRTTSFEFAEMEGPNADQFQEYMRKSVDVRKSGQLVSVEVGPVSLVSKKVQDPQEHSTRWDLHPAGFLEFQHRPERGPEHDRAVYAAPEAPGVSAIYENCFYDPSEVGFTIKN